MPACMLQQSCRACARLSCSANFEAVPLLQAEALSRLLLQVLDDPGDPTAWHAAGHGGAQTRRIAVVLLPRVAEQAIVCLACTLARCASACMLEGAGSVWNQQERARLSVADSCARIAPIRCLLLVCVHTGKRLMVQGALLPHRPFE